MTTVQEGGESRNAAHLLTTSVDFVDKDKRRGSKNPKMLWTSYMEAPLSKRSAVTCQSRGGGGCFLPI